MGTLSVDSWKSFWSPFRLVLRIAVDDSKSLRRLSSKFGAKLVNVGKLLERAGELGLEVIGVSFHVGSGCTESLTFKQAIADARHVFDIAVSHCHSSRTLPKYRTLTCLVVQCDQKLLGHFLLCMSRAGHSDFSPVTAYSEVLRTVRVLGEGRATVAGGGDHFICMNKEYFLLSILHLFYWMLCFNLFRDNLID